MPVMEIAIEPLGSEDVHLHDFVARCVKIVRQSGLAYRLGPMSTVVQGPVPQLMEVARRMHEEARHGATAPPRVVTTVRIDDTSGTEHTLDERVRVVEQALSVPM